MKYWQNYKRRIKLFLLMEREKKELPFSEIENSFGENFDHEETKTQIKKIFLP